MRSLMRQHQRQCWRTAIGAVLLSLAPLGVPGFGGSAQAAGAQQEAALGPILRAAIHDTGCDEHADRFDEEVFVRLHDRQLARFERDPRQRLHSCVRLTRPSHPSSCTRRTLGCHTGTAALAL